MHSINRRDFGIAVVATMLLPVSTARAEDTEVHIDNFVFEPAQLTVKAGHREITIGPKKQPPAIRLEVSRLDKGLYRIEVGDSLEAGEYSLSPEGSNQVFCFQVF